MQFFDESGSQILSKEVLLVLGKICFIFTVPPKYGYRDICDVSSDDTSLIGNYDIAQFYLLKQYGRYIWTLKLQKNVGSYGRIGKQKLP